MRGGIIDGQTFHIWKFTPVSYMTSVLRDHSPKRGSIILSNILTFCNESHFIFVFFAVSPELEFAGGDIKLQQRAAFSTLRIFAFLLLLPLLHRL